jgi:uncharacterized SAM-binding protein YcdF (DUF218 family)
MFLLLLRILLWVILIATVYFVVVKFIPKVFLAFLGTIIILAIISISFYNPNNILIIPAWEILSFPLKPLALALIFLILGIFKIKQDKIANTGKIFIGVSLIILLLSTSPIVAYELAKSMEIEGLGIKPIPPKCLTQQDTDVISNQDFLECFEFRVPPQQNASAIVLLGKDTTQPNLPYRTQIQLNNKGDRILYTAQLYKQQLQLGNNPLVIVSAAPRDNLTGDAQIRLETRDIEILLQELGVSPTQIVLDSNGFDVRSSAQETVKILTERGLNTQSILLVTSGINMRRANLTFSNIGLNIVPRPTDFYGFQSNAVPERKLRLQDFFPDAQALVTNTEVVDEFLATIYYFLRGWLSPPVL